VELGVQTIAILVKDEIHASVGAAGLFIKGAAGLLFLVRGRAKGYLLRPAEIDPVIRGGHRVLLFSPGFSRR
jgi:hypothetical protein